MHEKSVVSFTHELNVLHLDGIAQERTITC